MSDLFDPFIWLTIKTQSQSSVSQFRRIWYVNSVGMLRCSQERLILFCPAICFTHHVCDMFLPHGRLDSVSITMATNNPVMLLTHVHCFFMYAAIMTKWYFCKETILRRGE